MAAVSSEKWVKFFTRAGIPPRAAATYALTFSDNRIQLDMLLDLNKEYLRDMGITLMGDVIAILRHARQVHEELTHEKLLSSSKNPNNPVKPILGIKESALPPKQMKNSKTMKVLSRSSSDSSINSCSSSSESSSTASPPKKVSVPSRISDPNARPSVRSSGSTSTTMRSSGSTLTPVRNLSSNSTLTTHSHPSIVEKGAVKKGESQTESLKRKPTEISRPKPTEVKLDVEEVPVKKARRVLPEHEGGYKIKMPIGSTPRTQQILAKQKELASKKTVFERLGGSNSPVTDPSTVAVSSTTSDPSFTVTGIDNTKKSKGSSVFSRLGDKQISSSPVPSTSTGEKPPYVGILKNAVSKPVQRIATVVQKTSSMVADSLTSPSRNDIQSRIGAAKEVTIVKRSATVVCIPISKQDQVVKRSASIVTIPRQMGEIKRTGTMATASRPVKIVKTEGILGGHSSTVSRPVKSRLGAEEMSRAIQADVRHAPRTTTVVKQRIDIPRVNGSVPSSSIKKVTFGGTQGNVFSRLGS